MTVATRLTADEYRRDWLRDNHITETDAVLMRLHFKPCTCGQGDCPGWLPVVGIDVRHAHKA